MILKIGGSVLTEKDADEEISDSFDDVLDDVALSIPGDLILVHGAGSFGHPHAARHGIDEGTPSLDGAYETHAAVARLNRRVVEALNDDGIDAFPVHPSSCALRDADGVTFSSDAADALRDTGFLPVVHGDVIADSRGGASVLSGDEIAVELADDERVGMCTSAGGVLDADGETLDRVSSLDDIAAFDPGAKDVTGGISGKVEHLLSLPGGGRVFGPDDIGGFLDGEDVGTLVRRKT